MSTIKIKISNTSLNIGMTDQKYFITIFVFTKHLLRCPTLNFICIDYGLHNKYWPTITVFFLPDALESPHGTSFLCLNNSSYPISGCNMKAKTEYNIQILHCISHFMNSLILIFFIFFLKPPRIRENTTWIHCTHHILTSISPSPVSVCLTFCTPPAPNVITPCACRLRCSGRLQRAVGLT